MSHFFKIGGLSWYLQLIKNEQVLLVYILLDAKQVDRKPIIEEEKQNTRSSRKTN